MSEGKGGGIGGETVITLEPSKEASSGTQGLNRPHVTEAKQRGGGVEVRHHAL